MNRTATLALLVTALSGCSVDQQDRDFQLIDGMGGTTGETGDEITVRDFTDDCGSSEVPETYYLDEDSDGFGLDTEQALSCGVPSDEYVLRGGDCDDEDASLNPTTEWFEDADEDGFGTGDAAETGCEPTRSDLVRNSDDCNDSSGDGAAFFPGMTWYRDRDEDGYGDPDSPRVTDTCVPALEGHVLNTEDCNDTSADESPERVWYPDRDGDGYGVGESDTILGCERPTDFARTLDELVAFGDCDDEDADEFPGQIFYVDADGDGAGDAGSTPVDMCENPDRDNYVSNDNDCDDEDAARFFGNPEICDTIDNDCDNSIDDADFDVVDQPTWYFDKDKDRYGSGTPSMVQCFAPSGNHSTDIVSNDDCDDDRATDNPGATEECDGRDNDCDGDTDESGTDATLTTFYVDADEDSYGVDGTGVTQCDVPTTGTWATRGGDCNDAPATGAEFNPNTAWYVDADMDGEGAADASGAGIIRSCTDPANGYVRNRIDCDDTNPDINTRTVWYTDEDRDGWGRNNGVRQCIRWANRFYLGELTGLGDCNDVDDTLNPATIWVEDKDGDGFGDQSVTPIVQCTSPGGDFEKGLENTDCNDDAATGAAYYPGMTWYVDADGDGYGGTTTSSDTSCRTTFAGHQLTGDDCDDSESWTYPGAPEICDRKRNDCSDASWSSVRDMQKASFIGDDGTVVTWERPLADEMIVMAPDRDGRLNLCARDSGQPWNARIVADQINLDVRGLSTDTSPTADVWLSGEHQGEAHFPWEEPLIQVSGDPAEPTGRGSHTVTIANMTISQARHYATYTTGEHLGGTKGGAIYARNVNLDLNSLRILRNSAEQGHALYAENCGVVSIPRSVSAISDETPPTVGPVGSVFYFSQIDVVDIESGSANCRSLTNGSACVVFRDVDDAVITTSDLLLDNVLNHDSSQLALFDIHNTSATFGEYQYGSIAGSTTVNDDLVGLRITGNSNVQTECSPGTLCEIVGLSDARIRFSQGSGTQIQIGGNSDTNSSTFESIETNWDGDPDGADVLVWNPNTGAYVEYSSATQESAVCSQEADNFGCEFGTL